MHERKLKLVLPLVASDSSESGRLWGVAVALLALSAALCASLSGADRARIPLPARDLANEALLHSVEVGNSDDKVRRSLLAIRESLGRNPLDSRTRVAYAGLLLGLSRSLTDTRAAVFHAELAARVSPVTVPVVQQAALVIARAGEVARSLQLARQMFDYDGAAAARLLARLEPMSFRFSIEEGVPPRPEAWMAWYHQLRTDRRSSEAEVLLRQAHARWPDNLAATEAMASLAGRRRDWKGLEQLLPESRELSEIPANALLFGYRARLRAARGEQRGARDDLRTALALGGANTTVRIVAAEAFEALGELDKALSLLRSSLFGFRPGALDGRLSLSIRIAEFEDRHGRPGTALRLWRSVLELDPENPRARIRVAELTGAHSTSTREP